jgi:aspartate aminotransferase
MTGWRIGFTLAPKALIEAMDRVQGHSTSNPTSISQYAALAAVTGPQEPVAKMAEVFRQRRDRIVAGFSALPGCRAFRPDGAFYLWCDVSKLSPSADKTAAQWLEDALVAAIPGEGFGAPGWMRLSYAVSEQTIDEALRRLKSWLAQHGHAS